VAVHERENERKEERGTEALRLFHCVCVCVCVCVLLEIELRALYFLGKCFFQLEQHSFK
jgi:hypothetical protein